MKKLAEMWPEAVPYLSIIERREASTTALAIPFEILVPFSLTNPNFIAKQMGHTDAQMVYRVYGSWMEENNQDQVLILNQKLSDFAPPCPTP
jgi:hypothetical protein